MSNIYTEFARLYLRPGVRLTPVEVEPLLDRILGERGSYWVPVWYEISAGSHVDLQYGSGKSAGLNNLEAEELAPFEEIWVRFANEGSDFDEIYEWSPELGESAWDGYPRHRPCRYRFNEVRILATDPSIDRFLPAGLSWHRKGDELRAVCVGSYLALNGRIDMEVGSRVRLGTDSKRTPGGLPTPTTPCHGSARVSKVEPSEIGSLIENGDDRVERVELLHAGRIVHRTEWGKRRGRAPAGDSRSRCADDWDNCIDAEFARLRGMHTAR